MLEEAVSPILSHDPILYASVFSMDTTDTTPLFRNIVVWDLVIELVGIVEVKAGDQGNGTSAGMVLFKW